MTEEIQKDKNASLILLIWDRLLDTFDKITSQITSGRWLLTVAAGACLVHFAWTSNDPSKIIDLIKDIVIFYFVVRDTKPTSTNQENKTNQGGV